MSTLSEVEEGSELAKKGYTNKITVGFNTFNYKFTMNDKGDGFDTEKSDNFEMLINGYNPTTQKVEKGIYKLTLKTEGEAGKVLAEKVQLLDGLAIVILIPETVSFEIAGKSQNKWTPLYTGKFTNKVKLADKTEYIDRMTSNFDIEGEVSSMIPYTKDKEALIDSTTMKFKIGQDVKTNKGFIEFSYEHGGIKTVTLSGSINNKNGATDFSSLTVGDNIFDALGAIAAGKSIDDFKITLLEDVVISIDITDCEKLLSIQESSRTDRRNHANESTIQKYADEINKISSIKIESKATDQTIDVKMVAAKFGVDYLAMPAFKFAGEDEYEPMMDVLDLESASYIINIIDHATGPTTELITIVRQMLQFFNKLTNPFSEE